jgi:predicted DNA-binding transcriptional regulator AlpA
MASNVTDIDRETVNIEAAGKILGISRPTAYDLARRDALPVPVIRLGTRMVVSKRALEDLLNERKASGDTAA